MNSCPRIPTFVLAALVALLSCAGCAQDEPPESVEAALFRLEGAHGETLGIVAEELGARAESDPLLLEALIQMLRAEEPNPLMVTLRLELAQPDSFPDDDARRGAINAAVDVMASRLRSGAFGGGSFDVRPDQSFAELRVPKPFLGENLDAETLAERDREFGFQVLRAVLAEGRFELLTVVAPPDAGTEPASLWTGSRAAYDALVLAQSKVIDEAVAAGRVHAPGEPGFVLCAVPPAAGSSAHTYLLAYRDAKSTARFERQDFTVQPIETVDTGQAGLEFVVGEERRDDMRAWSTANLGRSAVIVINGVAGSPFTLREPLAERLVLLVGPSDDPRTHAHIASVLRAAQTPRLPHVMRGERVTLVGPDTMTPAAMTLVASGHAGAQRMGELRREGGAIGARAARILEWMGRRRTSGGERFVPGK